MELAHLSSQAAKTKAQIDFKMLTIYQVDIHLSESLPALWHCGSVWNAKRIKEKSFPDCLSNTYTELQSGDQGESIF